MRRPLGQHFLFDPRILKRIVDSSHVSPDDTVVEIGPGLGPLTVLLAERAKKVIAIEFDRKMVERLRGSLSSKTNVGIIAADALKFPYDSIQGRFRVVANIPYYITTPLIFRLLRFRDRLLSMTLLLQKELAQRIVAPHGSRDYGVLSITVGLYTRPVMRFTVPAGAFSPPPRVDSAVVHFEVFQQCRFDVQNEELLVKIVKTAFSQRRKTLSNSLRTFSGIKEALPGCGIDPKLRPEHLSIDDFVKLANALHDPVLKTP